jgi:hypothetical protein
MGNARLGTALVAGAMALSALPAGAVSVRDCDDFTSNIQSLAEPWEQNTKVFLNGSVRIALVDTGGEPVCCSTHLVVLAEDKSDEHGGRACKVVSDQGTGGFEWIDFPKIRATYHPARGLLLTMPVRYYIDGLKHRGGVVRIGVNTRNGAIVAQ